MNKAGDSGTGDSSSSTCYDGICMPACSQMVLDRWLLIFGCFFLFVCLYVVCVFFLYPARALRALGLLLADGAPRVGRGKTF